jgi:hypothetical protein
MYGVNAHRFCFEYTSQRSTAPENAPLIARRRRKVYEEQSSS